MGQVLQQQKQIEKQKQSDENRTSLIAKVHLFDSKNNLGLFSTLCRRGEVHVETDVGVSAPSVLPAVVPQPMFSVCHTVAKC